MSETAGLTLKKMLKNTPYNIVDKSEEKHILKLEKKVSKKGRTAVKAKVQRDKKGKTDKPDNHTCWIIGLDNEGPLSKQKCLVSCDCDNFKFQWEYALTHAGASKIKYSNGNPPTTTNPHLTHGVCSHLYAVITKISTQGI